MRFYDMVSEKSSRFWSARMLCSYREAVDKRYPTGMLFKDEH